MPIQQYSVHWCISIHSLRMEGDYTHLEIFQMSATFQSTPSAWRETHLVYTSYHLPCTFQSTPSAWRETHWHNGQSITRQFQSTPSAWRETLHTAIYYRDQGHFNPLPPHGGRLFFRFIFSLLVYFNPLPPHGGRRLSRLRNHSHRLYFNPLPPHGGRP